VPRVREWPGLNPDDHPSPPSLGQRIRQGMTAASGRQDGNRPGSADGVWTPASLVLPSALLLAAMAYTLVQPPDFDVDVYRKYADAMIRGPISLGLPHEYPALAGGLFALPHFLGVPYGVGFAWLMTGGFIGVMWVGRTFGEAWTRRTVLYLTLSVFALLLSRFDLLVALAILLSVRSGRRSSWRSAWAWALLGGFLKVIPFLLLPGLLIAERRETGFWPVRRLLAAGVTGLVAGLIQTLVAPGTLLNPLRYEIHRGFEYASLPGTISLLTSPEHLQWVFQFENIEVVSGFHSGIAAGTTVIAVLGIIGLWVLAYRRSLPIATVSLAVLTMAVLTSKSFAPQYLMWLAPLWALSGVRPAWVVCAALTTLVYPMLLLIALHASWRQPLYLITIVAAFRNMALAMGTGSWLWGELRTHDPALRPQSRATAAGEPMPEATLDRVTGAGARPDGGAGPG
jgi:hypothetical protein